MNRKKGQKEKVKIEKVTKLFFDNQYDDPNNWLRGDFAEPPWPETKIKDFQKRLDSAFEAENAIVLVWGGDRSFGDAFYTDWHFNGTPKGNLERKPVLLFGEFPVGEKDYVYVGCPRWCLMEVHHGSQLEDGWEESAWVTDPDMAGGKKRIRALHPPEFFYVHLGNGVIASHEQPTAIGSPPPCCLRMWQNKKRICYGKYRAPDDRDIAMIRGIRQRMNRDGVTQRNDTARSAKVIQQGNLATKHHMEQAERRRSSAVKEMMMANAGAFFGDLASGWSAKKTETIVRDALNKQEEERFSKV